MVSAPAERPAIPGDDPSAGPLVMVVAGEPSGDRHAASFFEALRRRCPGIRGIGMGGSAMRQAGIEILQDSEGLAVIGVVEVIRHYRTIRRVLKRMQALACSRKPDLLVCVDYKEFNFHLASAAKACGVPVLFYVGPQFWAWRPGRVKTFGRVVTHMAVIFPFEVPHYQAAGVPVTYVGHPLAGKVSPTISRGQALSELGFDNAGPIVGLLPGSRDNELRRLLPAMLQSAVLLKEAFPSVRFVLARAPSSDASFVDRQLALANLPVHQANGLEYDVLQCCDAVITSSGTATLELALLGLPMVIVYRLAPLTYWLGRVLVRIPYIGLPNILAGRRIVRELIQGQANPRNISDEIHRILTDPAYAASMRSDLAGLRATLGPGGGSENLAQLAAELIERHRQPTGQQGQPT